MEKSQSEVKNLTTQLKDLQQKVEKEKQETKDKEKKDSK